MRSDGIKRVRQAVSLGAARGDPSGIFTPSDVGFARDGVAAECSANIETVVVQDLDLELLRRSRFGGTVQNWNDRRHDLYTVKWTGSD